MTIRVSSISISIPKSVKETDQLILKFLTIPKLILNGNPAFAFVVIETRVIFILSSEILIKIPKSLALFVDFAARVYLKGN